MLNIIITIKTEILFSVNFLSILNKLFINYLKNTYTDMDRQGNESSISLYIFSLLLVTHRKRNHSSILFVLFSSPMNKFLPRFNSIVALITFTL